MHNKRNSVTRRDACPVSSRLLVELRRDVRELREDGRRRDRLFEAYILRSVGRPRHPKVTLAVQLLAEGKSLREVKRRCMPPSADLSVEARRQAWKVFMNTVRQRQRRASGGAPKKPDLRLPGAAAPIQ